MNRTPAVFLDRDGVLIEDLGYVHRTEDLRWIPGAQAAVRRFNELGWWVFVVTNQSGVARGMFGPEAVEAFHAAMQSQLAAAGARVDAFYDCPFHAEATVEAWRHPNHPDRKPNPGMLLRALAEHPVDRERSLLIGDKDSDLEAARRAGVEGRLFTGGDLLAFVDAVLAEKQGGTQREGAPG
jgi:D-glycero-D-manno-heptose 1,7-bisphosphate phosphatase